MEDKKQMKRNFLFVACNNGSAFAKKVKKNIEQIDKNSIIEYMETLPSGKKLTAIFDDTETRPRLPGHVAGSDSYVFQSFVQMNGGETINESIMQMLQMIRTLKVHGARTITAVTPYAAYARQDKPSFMQREATLAKLYADLLIEAGVNQVITYHPHTESIRGFYEPRARFVPISGMDLFIDVFKELQGRKDVVTVSTDAGGAKYAIHYAKAMNISHAIGNKFRPVEQVAERLGIIGDLTGKKKAIILDDESVTFGSVMNTCKGLYEAGIPEIYVGISHNKITKKGKERLVEAHEKYGLTEFHTTNSMQSMDSITDLSFVHVHDITERFARAIRMMHTDKSVSSMFYNPNGIQ